MTNLPLNSIRAFVVAAERLSFTQAAQDLHVTQGAVSQHVARLEMYLGAKLFQRSPAGLVLTATGRRYLDALANVIERIEDATAAIREDLPRELLGLTTLTSFASQWLMPRLPRFHGEHPSVRLRLETGTALTDLGAEGLDAAIRFGSPPWPRLANEPLFFPRFGVVARADVAARIDPAAGQASLAGVPVLYDRDNRADWTRWLRAAGWTRAHVNLAHGFSDSLVMLRALLAGDGIALMGLELVESELASGSLVQVYDTTIESTKAYHLVYPTRRLALPPLAVFRTWLLREVRRTA